MMTKKQQEILTYLIKHPDFLLTHAKELAISVNEKKVRSFAEVQILANKDQIQNLEIQLEEMYQIAEANHELIQKVIAIDHKLMLCTTIRQVVRVLKEQFSSQFKLSLLAMKLTFSPKKRLNIPSQWILPAGKTLDLIKKLDKPKTGTQCIDKDLYNWLAKGNQAESFLHLPLILGSTQLGILLIAHEDPEYFTENAPTDYVEIIAQSIAFTLARIMGIK